MERDHMNHVVASIRRRWDAGERGAAALEFALVLPLLLMFIFAIVEYGMVFLVDHDLTEAASDTTRALVTQTQLSAQALASTASAQVLSDVGTDTGGLIPKSALASCNTSLVRCTATTAPCAGDTTLTCLTVTVSYDYAANPVIPDILDLPMPSTLTASSVVIMTGGLTS